MSKSSKVGVSLRRFGRTFMSSALAVAAVALLTMSAGCGSDDTDNGGTESGSCEWFGNCGNQRAPNGAHDCDSNTLVQCQDGEWVTVAVCGGFLQGSRRCTCKGGCGVDTTECSFAFQVCGGQVYDTCGPNAEPVMTDVWMCVQ